MQRVPNYGSYLQAMGLKQIIEKLGHDVVFIDYIPCPPVTSYSKIYYFLWKIKSTGFISQTIDNFRYYFLKRKPFDLLYKKNYLPRLEITYKKTYNKEVDVAVVGSDEVFNCIQSGFNVGYSPMLFGSGIKTKRVFSYAASFGYTTIEKLKEYKIYDEVMTYMKAFDYLSVRDRNSFEIIKNLTGKRAVLNLDPVLISDYDIPDVEIKIKDYVVLYTYKSRKYTDEEKKQIKSFCKKNKKVLLSIGDCQDWVDVKIDAFPLELLAYIKNADFVITDTFHGSVFSIKYNKNFVTRVRDDNFNKLFDLLERLNQEDRIIQSYSNLEDKYFHSPDFTQTNRIIAKEKKKTIDYLNESILGGCCNE